MFCVCVCGCVVSLLCRFLWIPFICGCGFLWFVGGFSVFRFGVGGCIKFINVPINFVFMARRRISEETDRHIKAAIQEIERVEKKESNGTNNFDEYRKPRIGISPDKIILDAVKRFMLEDERFDFGEFRDNLIDAD